MDFWPHRPIPGKWWGIAFFSTPASNAETPVGDTHPDLPGHDGGESEVWGRGDSGLRRVVSRRPNAQRSADYRHGAWGRVVGRGQGVVRAALDYGVCAARVRGLQHQLHALG